MKIEDRVLLALEGTDKALPVSRIRDRTSSSNRPNHGVIREALRGLEREGFVEMCGADIWRRVSRAKKIAFGPWRKHSNEQLGIVA